MVKNIVEAPPVPAMEDSEPETEEKKKERLEDEERLRMVKEIGNIEKAGARTRFQGHQDAKRDEELLKLTAGGAVVEFDEDGGVKVQPTSEQLQGIQTDWKHFVNNLEERYANMSTDKLEKTIRDLQKPDRRRPGPLGDTFKRDPEGEKEHEQLERAALMEVLNRRKSKEKQ